MGSFNVNINPSEILAQNAQEAMPSTKMKNKFDLKNYLNTRLSDNEVTKTLTIRLLPYDKNGGVPFHKVHMHQVRVNKEVSASGWKTFPCPIKNKLGEVCPYCEQSASARECESQTIDEVKKKAYHEIAFESRAREFWIVRCIERGHEEDGVKFWLFPVSRKNDGVYDKIFNLFQQRSAKGKNIFDLNNGKDLLITVTRDSNGKSVINIADDDELTPLSDDYDKAVSWLNDEKKWNEVYPVKPYEYMAIVMKGGVPYYSKEKGGYVDKQEALPSTASTVENNLEKPTEDLSRYDVLAKAVAASTANSPLPSSADDDLPF